MSTKPTENEDELPEVEPIIADSYLLSVNREGWIGIRFHVGDKEVANIIVEPGMAQSISDNLSADGRKKLWDMARQHLDTSLN